MATKLQIIRGLADKTANDLTTLHGNWQHFLETAARLYKYPFPDQMLIYAQKPDAVAVAEIELWNEKFDRWVKRGTKGIALIDDTGHYPRLRYVFDVQDTEPSRFNARPVQLWEMRQEHKDSVIAALANNYEDIDEGDSLANAFHSIASQLAREYYSDNANDIQYRAEDSVLAPQALYDADGIAFDERDNSHLESTFIQMLSNSIAYTLMSRCGIDAESEFEAEDFQAIADFNTTDIIYALGTATSELSEQVLRDIEIVIRKYERVQTAERSEQNYDRNPYLQPSGRLSASELNAIGNAGGTNAIGQIRTDEESVPQRTQDNQLQPPVADGEAVPTSSGDRPSSDGATRTSDDRAGEADTVARQGDRPNGLDSGDEHAESASGGNGSERTDLRIDRQEKGAAEEAAPFSMAEQAQHHVRWNELIIDAVVHDETILNAAVNSDRENTIIEVESLLNRLHLTIRQDIIDSAMSNKSGAINELDSYFTKDRKPPLAKQLYDTVIRSDEYKERLTKNETPSEQEMTNADNGLVSNDSRPQTASMLGKNSITELLSTSAVTLAEVDAILRDGGNFDSHKLNDIPYNSRSSLRIAAHFAKNRDDNDLFLQREYLRGRYNRSDEPSGKGIDFGNHNICAWFDVDGISLAIGTTAKNNAHKITIPWEVAAERIKELYDEGQYITPNALSDALDNEHRELAESLWHFYRDDMDGIPDEWNAERGGYPEDVAKIKGLLDNPETRQPLIDRVTADIAAYKPEEHERRWHNRHRLLYDVHAVGYAPIYPPQATIDSKTFKYFITQDEIDALLAHGSSVSEGKFRTLSFFLNNSGEKERINFLKDEYGHGGGTWSQTGGWRNAEPGQGLTLQRGSISKPDAEVNLKWNAVARRIDTLIRGGQYMTRPELDRIESYEKLMLARVVNNFYATLPSDDYVDERPFTNDDSLYYPTADTWAAIADYLGDSERVNTTIERMRYVFENTHTDDRYFNTRKSAFERLTSFRDGEYTLFPGIESLITPEAAAERQIAPPAQDTPTRNDNGIVINLDDGRSIDFSNVSIAPTVQLTLFDAMPELPSAEEQQQRIDQSLREEAAEIKAASDILENDIDSVLLNISNEDKARLYEQFADNPRSRTAVNLVKEIYGSTLPFPLPQAIKRLGELVELGQFDGIGDPYNLFDQVRDELSERGYAVSGELIEDSINEFRSQVGYGEFTDVADFIENEYLMDEPDAEYDAPQMEATPVDFLSEVTRIKDEHGNPIVMWQVGDFYEMYGDDAINAAEILAVAMTERSQNVSTPYLVTGIPSHALDQYRQKLVEAGFSVAVSSIGESNERNLVLYEAETQPEPELVPPPSFDTVAQTVYDRVMADDNYAYHLQFAQSRGTLRSPLNNALDKVIGEMKAEEPTVYGNYFTDDITDNLFDHVYRESWANRPQPEVEQAQVLETEQKLESVFGEVAEITDPIEFAEIETIFGDTKEPEPPRYQIQKAAFVQVIQSNPSYVGLEKPKDFKNYLIRDTKEERFVNDPHGEHIGFVTEREAQAYADKLNRGELMPPLPYAPNFRIADDHLGEGGAKTKYRNNVEAIKIIKTLETANRNATPDEQQTLSRYVGWGGLPQAFDESNKDWANEYTELSSLLTPEEYDSARASTLNAHYTSPVVIKAMWETVERMGFKSGNILEPSMGIGNFFGLIPQDLWQSKLYGVELDRMTASIAKKLYPNTNIQQTGFEKTEFSDAFFDLAIGNVPFGNYGVADSRYKQNFHIHDYFFQKSLDKVRPGGVVAFITSKFTMDSKSPEVRKYIAQRAELLGAVRLPNTAFLKNAGTETTMDILFLQKRDRPLDIEPDWVHLGRTEDGIPCNRYYIDNPEMVCGIMGLDEHMNNKYGRDDYTACLPIEGADLGEQLKAALLNVQGTYTVTELDDLDGVDNHAIPADYSVKNFSYAVVENTVYFRENSLMYPVDLPAITLERIKGMISLRDCVQELITLQLDDYSDGEIKAKQQELSDLYDGFIAEFGLINSTANNRAFNADSSYYLLCSLEIIDEDGELDRKADMFTKRTIKQKTVVTHVDTASEALAVSLGEKACVDLPYMVELTGMEPQAILKGLEGIVYQLPQQGEPTWVTADDYLSGNIREKLRTAKEYAAEYPEFDINVRALEAVMPKDLEAGEIAVRLGATWIDPEYIQQFMYELLDTNWRNQSVYQVKYHQFTGEWQVTGKGKSQFSDIPATMTFGTSRMNAYQIIEESLNLRDVRVYDRTYDPDGKERRILNKKETTLAQQKQEIIKQRFKDWLWSAPERRQTLVAKYNERFNSVRPREYDGSHITFGGISPEIELKPHQLNAIAHILYGGNTLLAHVVGAGKTFEMTAAAMEMKRLGQCHKSMFAVPNHLTEQWAGEFLRLYPSANILVATKKDFEMRNRKKFCAKIATGDYDAVRPDRA